MYLLRKQANLALRLLICVQNYNHFGRIFLVFVGLTWLVVEFIAWSGRMQAFQMWCCY